MGGGVTTRGLRGNRVPLTLKNFENLEEKWSIFGKLEYYFVQKKKFLKEINE